MQITEIQAYLREAKLDGWLLADFHGRNDVALMMLGISGLLTRRAFYFIPAEGEPTALVNPIETSKFASQPGRLIAYNGYRGLEAELSTLLSGCRRVAMEYSPMGRLPYIGLVDAGTIELVRSFGVKIESSADLVANFQALLSPEQIAMHRMAARNLIEIKEAAFNFIADQLTAKNTVTEFDVCTFIQNEFKRYSMTTQYGPNCSVNGNAGDPHYEPSAEESEPIERDQIILIDLWAKLKNDLAVYADITWMAYSGTAEAIPTKFSEPFAVLVTARDTAVTFLRDRLGKQPVYGYEVDDACRAVIEAAGFGQYFTHRTGHSITTSEHGPGPNIDNLETEDKRKLQTGHLFSIEPGIYMSDCGFRTEIDCLIGSEGLEVTTLPLQTKIRPLW